MQEAAVTITLVRPSAQIDAPPRLQEVQVKPNDTIEMLAQRLLESPGDVKHQVLGALVNNILVPLSHRLSQPCRVQLLDLSHQEGRRIYQRTALFILAAAARECMPDARLRIEHTLSNGIYGEFFGEGRFTAADVMRLDEAMRRIVQADYPITSQRVPLQEAKDRIAASQSELENATVLRALGQADMPEVTLYTVGDFVDYTDGPLLPSTGYVREYRLRHYMPGFILQTPEKAAPPEIPAYHEQPKLTGIYREAERWASVMQISDVAALNALSPSQAKDLININEAFHEKKIAQLADQIARNRSIRLITIAGPSSSGKTTFSQRLLIQLRVNGLHPLTLHLDDYFLSRDETPIDEDGNPDFEAIEAIDLDLFNDHLARLIEGESVEVPTFDFEQGGRVWTGKSLTLPQGQPIIVEGIHGLNDRLTEAIPKASKFKIYISALTQLNIHDRVRIHTTDARLLRRMVRDAKFRGLPADGTLTRWPMVRRGEERNIFPFQEDADAMFNSALLYELGVLKPFAEECLRQVPANSPNRHVANHLEWLLSHVRPMESEAIPPNSILREFIGGSTFH